MFTVATQPPAVFLPLHRYRIFPYFVRQGYMLSSLVLIIVGISLKSRQGVCLVTFVAGGHLSFANSVSVGVGADRSG